MRFVIDWSTAILKKQGLRTAINGPCLDAINDRSRLTGVLQQKRSGCGSAPKAVALSEKCAEGQL
jgi:hypothetical protein